MSSVYFDLYDKNKKLKKNAQYFLAFSKAIKAVDYIEKENLSDVPVIWPLVEVTHYLPVFKEAKSKSLVITNKIKNNDDIGKEWIVSLEEIPEKSDMLDKILNYLKENPGSKQSKLWSTLDIDGRVGANLIHYAEQLNAIKREKENGKNILYSKEKPSFKKVINKTSTRKNINRKRVNKKQFQEKNKSLFDKMVLSQML
jgi:hypothetical protein